MHQALINIHKFVGVAIGLSIASGQKASTLYASGSQRAQRRHQTPSALHSVYRTSFLMYANMQIYADLSFKCQRILKGFFL